MLDISWIRDFPKDFDALMHARGESFSSQEILALDQKVRALKQSLDDLRSKKNQNAKCVAGASGAERGELISEGGALRSRIDEKEEDLRIAQEVFDQKMAWLPNRLDPEVPIFETEAGNKTLHSWGAQPSFDFSPKTHDVLGAFLGLSAEDGVQLSGARFVVLRKQLAALERALAQWFLDVHTKEFGYHEHSVPFVVKEEALFCAGQLPKFQSEVFGVGGGKFLISTAEVPLVNLARGKTISAESLPEKYVAHTPCFRAEAGAAGRDTKGLIRLHQFSKVELVSFSHPKMSEEVHQAMLGHAETLLQRLGLPYRVVLLASGDTGFHAYKTYDIEVWMAGQKEYREIASCSNCFDFQSRRLKSYVKDKSGKRMLLHTLNSSGLPLGRTLAALIEAGQQKDGSVLWPAVLKPYLSGVSVRFQ